MFFKKKPKKVFEDYFSEIQTDMVDICLEYAENYADMIYIYCSYEHNVLAADVFYKINGTCLRKHKLNEAPGEHPEYTTSIDNQKIVVRTLMDDLHKIIDLFKTYQRPMPTQIKLFYNPKTGSFNAAYEYEPVYTNLPDKTADDVLEDWIIAES